MRRKQFEAALTRATTAWSASVKDGSFERQMDWLVQHCTDAEWREAEQEMARLEREAYTASFHKGEDPQYWSAPRIYSTKRGGSDGE